MSLVISDEILQWTRLNQEEFKREIAVFLYQKEKLTLGQASRLAEMNPLQFQHVLAGNQIPVHYDIAEFEEDLKTLHELNHK